MRKFKSSSKNNSSKKKYTIRNDKNSNIIFESILKDEEGNKNIFRIIKDKSAPFLRQEIKNNDWSDYNN